MVYVFLVDGFEEIEALAPVDIMRRAGIDVRTVGVTGDVVYGSHSIPVQCDCTVDRISKSDDIEAIVLPGGPGAQRLEDSEYVQELLTFAHESGKLICAICAAPFVIGHRGFLNGKKATCFPGYEKELEGAEITGESVTRDGSIITGKGAGVALEFGFEIVSFLKGAECADKIRKSMQCK